MIIHEIPLVFRVSDYAIILNNGEKLFEGSKECLVEQETIFDEINIKLPPVVQLSKMLGFDQVVFRVKDFMRKLLENRE